jgi:DGQHR domain-containing protein
MNKIIEIKGFTVNQLTHKPIATTSIKFEDLIKIVKFTARESSDFDPFKPMQNIEHLTNKANDQYFQRLTNDDRVKGIYLYLIDEINNKFERKKNALGSFPTSIILAIDLNDHFESKDDYIKNVINLEKNDLIGAHFEINDRIITLSILNRNNTLIVDGQHRLAAMLKLFNDAKEKNIKFGRKSLIEKYPNLNYDTILEYLNEFELNCTLLLGFDIWEQGKVFADVNFNQKPVNKSLYYDIFGSFPDSDKNDIFLAHMLVLHLNNNKDSVIKGYIKLLGTGSGYFSQAFFVEAILEHLKPRGIWADIPMDYLNEGKKFEILPKFLKSYLKSIKENFIDFWPKESYEKGQKYDSILVKTTGMGALIKLMSPIYRDLIRKKIDFNTIEETELKEEFDKILRPISNEGINYFSKTSNFSGAGSLGLQNKLYQKLGEDIGYFKF